LQLDSRKSINARLARPFGDVFEGNARGAPASVSNCQDYLRRSEQGFEAASEREGQILHNQAVECVALKMLRSARTPQSGMQLGFELGAGSLSVLPPSVAPAVSEDQAEAAKSAEASGKSWASFLPEAVAKPVAPGELAVSQPGWSTHLWLYARGDFSGHGREEILMRADYRAEGGTYASSQLFLLGGRAKTKRLRLIRQIPVR
jgi:hypothetical protein